MISDTELFLEPLETVIQSSWLSDRLKFDSSTTLLFLLSSARF